MDAREEANFIKKAEADLAGHRTFPNGRDYRCFIQHAITNEERDRYRANFDLAFPDAPGAGV